MSRAEDVLQKESESASRKMSDRWKLFLELKKGNDKKRFVNLSSMGYGLARQCTFDMEVKADLNKIESDVVTSKVVIADARDRTLRLKQGLEKMLPTKQSLAGF